MRVTDMLRFLKQHFSSKNHYLVLQRYQDEINSFFIENLFHRTQVSHKKELWGKASETIPYWGEQLGWIPDNFPLIFLSDTVELEIAEALSFKKGELLARQKEIDIARSLLSKLEINELAPRNPFFLSEGETKMVWLLSQWAKFPLYLVIGNLATSLSSNRIDLVVEFLLDSDRLAKKMGSNCPIIILGCYEKESSWSDKILSNSKWKFLTRWPASNKLSYYIAES